MPTPEEEHVEPSPLRKTSWRPRFSILTLMLLMLVCSIVAAGGSYLANYVRGGFRAYQLVFLLFVLAGPVVVMIVVSLILRVGDFTSQRRRRP